MIRLIQGVGFVFGLLYTLLIARFVLVYIEARPVGFVRLVTQWSDVFFRPFRGIVANGQDPGGHPLPWSIVVAIVAYALLHGALVALLRTAARTTGEAT